MTYHFIGLGGIGMSALARILAQKGFAVQGSDAKESALLDALQKEGIHVRIGHASDACENASTVVYNSDVREDNVELLGARAKKLPILHRSDLLHECMTGKKSLQVAGSHGKTTTTALLAHVLITAGWDPSFVVGGIVKSLETNGRFGKGEYFVAESDESDGSFLKTPSFGAIVTNISDEHLGFWGSPRALDLAFKQFMAQTGTLVWCKDDVRLDSLNPRGQSYGFSEEADIRIENFRTGPAGITFDVGAARDLFLPLHGKHNAQNSTAVFALATHLGITESTIRKAFASFQGTKRRLEKKQEKRKVVLFDDYGHHPREIQATLAALREIVQERRLVVVFQPHRYTRVRDLFDSFCECFHEADELFLTDIYSAGEKEIPEVSSAALYTKMREKMGAKVHFLPRSHLESGVAAALEPLDAVLTLGAGDITQAGEPILTLYEERAPKLHIGIIAGGKSAEHEVSLMSAQTISNALDPTIYTTRQFTIGKDGAISSEMLSEIRGVDVVIPVLHGPNGEDGMMAAFLTALRVPYVGCDSKSGAVCMQKTWAKVLAANAGVPIVPYLECTKETSGLERIEAHLPYPVWVKPVHLGSSIGVSRAGNREELMNALALAFRHDHLVLVEKEIVGRQIEFGILGNDFIDVALPAEIVNFGAFVSYDKKYGSDAMDIRTPAAITDLETRVGEELAKTVYKALHAQGLSRVDFFLDEQGHFWFNEINPFPGCTATSAFPKMWEASGKKFSEVIDRLLILAMHKWRTK